MSKHKYYKSLINDRVFRSLVSRPTHIETYNEDTRKWITLIGDSSADCDTLDDQPYMQEISEYKGLRTDMFDRGL